jgi:hypothetical protein
LCNLIPLLIFIYIYSIVPYLPSLSSHISFLFSLSSLLSLFSLSLFCLSFPFSFFVFSFSFPSLSPF